MFAILNGPDAKWCWFVEGDITVMALGFGFPGLDANVPVLAEGTEKLRDFRLARVVIKNFRAFIER